MPNINSAVDKATNAIRTISVGSSGNPTGTNAPQGIGAYQTVTLQNAATATGNGTSIDTSGMGVLNVAVTGTFVGTVAFEVQDASGAWNAIYGQVPGTPDLATTTTSTGVWIVRVTGFSGFRARISAYTSGSITAAAFAENSAPQTAIQNVNQATATAGEDLSNDVLKTTDLFDYVIPISTSGTVKTGAGRFAGFFVSAASATPTIAAYDGTSTSGNKIIDTFTPTAGTLYRFPTTEVSVGVYIAISGTVTLTPFVK